MRHHARRLLTALAAAACLGCAAAPAGAVEVRIDVTNAAAPTVRIVTPADGSRIVAGATVPVRVEGGGADTLSMAVDATPTWAGPGNLLAGRWSPEVGTHRLVAVARRTGAPDAVAVSEVRVVPRDDDAGAALPPSPPPAGSEPPGASTPGSTPSPASPGPVGAGPAPGGPVTPALVAPAPSARRPSAAAPPAGPSAAALAPTARRESADDASPLMALVRAIGRILSSPERVAWAVAFPLLLVIAAIAYVLLQRFIDGGPKLAWRGRGRADDQVIEF